VLFASNEILAAARPRVGMLADAAAIGRRSAGEAAARLVAASRR
jgi:hypothetical protein